MIEHRPNSMPTFVEKRDYLLSLLPFKKSKETEPEDIQISSNQDILKQNIPNPFSNTTTISYELKQQSSVVFKVYNSKGTQVKSIDLSSQKEGLNHFDLNMQNMPKGMYFYSIYINGNLSGSKKMIVK